MMTLAHRWLPGFTLLAWSAVLLFLTANGQVKSLLTPAFRPWVIVAGVVLAAMALALFLIRKPATDCCGCEHDHDHGEEEHHHGMTSSNTGRLLTSFILIVPMVVAAMFSPDSYSASTVRNRGLIENSSGLGKMLPPESVSPGSVLDYMEKTPDGYYSAEVVDFVFAADEPDLRNALDGQTVAVVGQILEETENNPNGNRFKVMRMFMMCCAADARPVGVAVETEALPDIPEMSWIRVVAKATFQLEGGRNQPVLQAISVKKVDPPEESMLF